MADVPAVQVAKHEKDEFSPEIFKGNHLSILIFQGKVRGRSVSRQAITVTGRKKAVHEWDREKGQQNCRDDRRLNHPVWQGVLLHVVCLAVRHPEKGLS